MQRVWRIGGRIRQLRESRNISFGWRSDARGCKVIKRFCERAWRMQMEKLHKIVLLGDLGTGKTSLVIRMTKNAWIPDLDPNFEDSFRTRVEVGGEQATLEIMDTAGGEEYEAMRDRWIRTAEAFLLIFSITDRKGFEKLNELIDRIFKVMDSEAVPMVIVGNKSDLQEKDRLVSKTEGTEFAALHKCPYIETSAKFGDNVQEVFHAAVLKIRELRRQPEQSETEAKSRVSSKRDKRCVIM